MTKLIKIALVVTCCVSLNKASASDQKYSENMGKPATQATSANPEEQVIIKGSADASQAVCTRSSIPVRCEGCFDKKQTKRRELRRQRRAELEEATISIKCAGCFDNKQTERSKQRKNRARLVEQESHTAELIKSIGQGLYVIRQPSPTPREE